MRWGEYQVCRGEVERVDAGSVTVRFAADRLRTDQCGGCRACGAGYRPESRVRIPLSRARPVLPGQAVLVRRFVANTALAAAAVFGLPLALMVAGLAAAAAVQPRSAGSPAAFIGAVAGLGLGALLARLADLAMSRRAGPPQIVTDGDHPKSQAQS